MRMFQQKLQESSVVPNSVIKDLPSNFQKMMITYHNSIKRSDNLTYARAVIDPYLASEGNTVELRVPQLVP